MRLVAIALFMAAAAAAQTVADLGWIAGHWSGSEGAIEEFWTAPSNGNMVGVFRMARKGKVTLTEHLSIDQEEGGPVLRLRHFNAGMIGWEEKDKPMIFRLSKSGPREALFVRSDVPGGTSLLFRSESPDKLVVILAKDSEGKMQEFPFEYRRVRSQ